jgi:UDP-N-acetylglucosamine 2-epimerase (non-hydrolysing)
MPEEVNRLVTDRLAEVLLAPSQDAVDNLRAEGEPPEEIHLVGNIMIDSLFRHLPAATRNRVRDRFPLVDRPYAVLTLHRPSNVDAEPTLRRILDAVTTIAADMPIVFPVHPRTRQRLADFGVNLSNGQVVLTEPLGYIDFLSLTSNARIILTDSGGLQEESTALGIPCLTLRENTERPITVTDGTNQVVGTSTGGILAGYRRALDANGVPRRPPLWDGQTAGRIARVLTEVLSR